MFLMAGHPIAAAVRAWCEQNECSITTASATVAERFGVASDTPASRITQAERTGHMSEEWADRFVVALDLEVDAGPSVLQPGLDAYCPGCRQVQPSRGDGTCLWCDCQTGGNTIPSGEDKLKGKRVDAKGRNAGVPYCCTEEDVLEIRRLYLTGLSMRAACAEVFNRTAYTSLKSMTMTMYDIFIWRGWKRRDQGKVTTARNYKHGQHGNLEYRRRARRARGEVRGVTCCSTKKTAPGAGKPCKRMALADSDYCRAHDPRFAEERAAHWAQVREQFEGHRDSRRKVPA